MYSYKKTREGMLFPVELLVKTSARIKKNSSNLQKKVILTKVAIWNYDKKTCVHFCIGAIRIVY